MKLDSKRLASWFSSFVLFSGGLLLCVAFIACGGDDDDDDDSSSDKAGSDVSDTGGTSGQEESNAGEGGSETSGEITAEQKQAVCQCWFDVVDIDVPKLNQQCEEKISDSCVTCTEEITNGASCSGMEASELSSCLSDCLHLISEPDSVDSCKELVSAGTSEPSAASAGTCMCENCFDVYAPCMANSACLRVILCVAEQGCNGVECMDDPVCKDVIADAATADPSLLNTLTSDISPCSTENSCLAE